MTQGFPYPHRTLAEVFAEEDAIRAHCLSSMKGPNSLDRRVGDDSRNVVVLGEQTKLPHAPCPRCGARGWCGHAGRLAA